MGGQTPKIKKTKEKNREAEKTPLKLKKKGGGSKTTK